MNESLSADTLTIDQIKSMAQGSVTGKEIIPLEYIPVILGALALGVILVLNKKPRKRKNPKKEIIPISVCVDCNGYIANSEFSPDLSEKDEKRILSHEKYYTDLGYWIAYGGEDLGFSWRPCELCERPEGGERYQASLIKG